jgi:nitrate reductase NapD
MHLSSVLVYSVPKHIEKTISALTAFPELEIHHQCQDTGRLVVVQESHSTEEQVDCLKQIKAIPTVMAAELVYHLVEDGHDSDVSALPQKHEESESWT